MWRARYVLSLTCVLCSLSQLVHAEGSAEFDVADGLIMMSRTHDQAVDTGTVAYVDILDGSNEKICYKGDGSALSVFRPRPNQAMLVGTLNHRQCVDAVGGVNGAYLLDLGTQTLGTEWDIRVCAKSVSNMNCLDNASNERLGRLWSYDWSFQSNLNYGRDYSINGSIYAIVPGGGPDRDAVVEMQMRGVSGARYHLFANSYGPETDSGQRIGRSAPAGAMQTNRVTPEFPIYLNPPEVARYNWTEPVVSEVKIKPECGTAVVSEVAPGAISFQSNIVGQYVVVCDVNRDDVYNLADNADFSSFGTAVVGLNTVMWDGRSKGGTVSAPGDYKCVIRLNVGEFHFMAEDIETADPGIRMYRVEKEQSGVRARTPIRMFWDDGLVPSDSELVPSNEGLSPNGSPPEGLDPGAYADDFKAYYLDGSMPLGNARAWGNYDADGKGNDSFLDQFTSAATVQSAPITITVMTKDGDPDNDGLSTVRECELKSDPRKADTDADGVRDGFEASDSSARDSDGDGVIDILDDDDDDDGIPTKEELGADENGDGEPDDAVDSDGDGKPDFLDTDSDGDGVPDRDDVARTDKTLCRDSDNDRCDDCSGGQGPDPAQDGPDSNGDGRCDAADDADGDGVLDKDDLDIDNDGIPNDVEGFEDFDGDGVPNSYDLDSDGDGLPDILEAGGGELDQDHDGRIDSVEDTDPKDGLHDPLQKQDAALPYPDTDGDGQPDFLDLDSDGDGLSDLLEGAGAARAEKLDKDGDGRIDDDKDRNHNGLADVVDPSDSLSEPGDALDPPDTDEDGALDFQDADDDGDSRSTKDEREDAERFDDLGSDVDEDGIPNWLDTDSDGDGISDEEENIAGGDNNGDGIPDYLQPDVEGGDRDSDGDGVPDSKERPNGEERDKDGDGIPDHLDDDDDGDGVPTRDERPDGEDRDTDGDGTPDYLDDDDDGDGVPTRDERPDGEDRDTDRDGIPDYLDDDDDGDRIPTRDERPDGEDLDTDGDGSPNYLDADDDGDGIPTRSERGDADDDGTPDYLQRPTGTLLGGARCSVTSPGAAGQGGARGWLAAGSLLALMWMWRLRRLKQFLWLVMLLGLSSLASAARAQVALDQFKPAPLASDGFGVSRPDVSGHMVLGTTLWIDYANDPLAYEVKRGDSSSQQRVVRDHLVLHAGLSLGLGDRVSLFALLPVHLVMKGEGRLSLPNTAPEGAGLGDLALGARIRLLGDVTTTAALSGEIIARVPTAELANNDQRYSGDAVGSYEPALIGEVRSGPFDVRLRAGARLRKATQVGNLDLDQELVYGVGARLRLTEIFSLHAEVYGSTFFKDVFGRAYSPLELLAGGKLRAGDLVLGLAAGPGLFQGYGSPDLRIVGLVGYAPQPPKPASLPAKDSDGDGLLDADDDCPNEPEDRDNFQDEDGCPDPDNDQDGVLDGNDRCPVDPEDRDQFEDEDGCVDPDNDRDGVLDSADKCPNEPEDRDNFQDEDGCPDPDNDLDRLLDAKDKCPNEPEDYDGFEDRDGCPEEGSGLVKLTCERIEIKEAVYFDTNADTIQKRSFPLLDQVSEMLNQAEHVKRVRIEGHTDNRGSPQYNLELSKRRAASVLRYLSEHGVEASRLESEGYGLAKPIADNNTDQGRGANRRVEFIVAEQSSQCK
jgi:outer membrane protein OmpA-like peptidoglycan-associated protein